MNLGTTKIKKTALLGMVFTACLFSVVFIDSKLAAVSAQIMPVMVNVDHLDFGLVFPGENLQSNFSVTYVPDSELAGVVYKIIQERKPLPENHPEFPNGGDPEMPGYYRNLCPFLTKTNSEGEEDTENLASVGPGDVSDTWIVSLNVPAIQGFVAQEHTGGIVDTNGEYGCDISIDIVQ